MPGRPLRHARKRAIDALTPERAGEVAAIAVRYLDRATATGAILMALHGTETGSSRELRLQVVTLPHAEARRQLTELVGHHPETARVVIALVAQEPEVEAALGIERTPRQRNGMRTRARTRDT